MYDFDRKYLEVIFEGDGDMGSQARLDDDNGKQKRIGGDVDMRSGDKLKVKNFTAQKFVNLLESLYHVDLHESLTISISALQKIFS